MKALTTFLIIGLQTSFFAQQIGNSGFENWDNLGSNQEEPTNWSSFKTASGSLSSFASQQVERSSAVRPGASGAYCARIWSKSMLGVMANGVLTTGRMNMGSSNLSSPENYNYSVLGNAAFSEALTQAPDSIVFWARYTAGSSEKAGMHALIHDQFAVQDPVNSASQPYIVAEADVQFSPTNNAWKRFSVPFEYTVNTGLVPKFILLTFTTNHIPGGGSANDQVLIDDVQLIYNTVGFSSQDEDQHYGIYIDAENQLILEGFEHNDHIEIYRLNGQLVVANSADKLQGFALGSGFYIIRHSIAGTKLYVP
ncbi:MAG: hypothetical protein FJ349_01495 [Sphingomonadales bacterium]|nr:hypothetical protein [Sphingomonadales bacterium]